MSGRLAKVSAGLNPYVDRKMNASAVQIPDLRLPAPPQHSSAEQATCGSSMLASNTNGGSC